MQQQEFEGVFAETMQSIKQLLVVKGGEYAGSEDRLSNFKRGAQLTGATPLQVAFIYASKHYDAIATYVRDEASGTERPRSESIEGRLDDLINYMILTKAIIKEDKANVAIPPLGKSWGAEPYSRGTDPRIDEASFRRP